MTPMRRVRPLPLSEYETIGFGETRGPCFTQR